MLFKDAPDLMDEFKDFLPEAVPPQHPAGLVGILPQPTTGPGMPGTHTLRSSPTYYEDKISHEYLINLKMSVTYSG